MTNAADLCQYILYQAYKENDRTHASTGFQNLWLQKTLYYVCGNHIARFNTPLLPSEFEAWMYGPVYPEAYLRYRDYKSNPIPRPIGCPSLAGIDKEAHEVMDSVIHSCSHLSASELVRKTHLEDPWLDASQQGTHVGSGVAISNESMKRYFSNHTNC